METTPLYDDVVNIIMDMVKPPTFEVGKTYYQIRIGYSRVDIFRYKVLKRTKCFITIQHIYEDDAPIKKTKIKKNDNDDSEYTDYNLSTLYAKDVFDEEIHKIIWKGGMPKVVRKGEELNHLLPKTKPPRLDIVNGVCYKYPTIKPLNPKIIKLREERERKEKELHKLQEELDIIRREESEILYADLDL